MNIVFTGNCQMFWLQEYYRRCIAPDRQDVVAYIDPRAPPSEADRQRSDAADLIVEQRLEFAGSAGALGRAGTPRHAVPLVAAHFLWPFAGTPHPANRPMPGLSFGPYPNELGDSFLNRMIARGVDPTTAVDCYLAQDLATVAHLSRRKELALGLQQERDTATGYRIAPLIEGRVRVEPVFFTPTHPRLPIFHALLSQFLQHMAVPAATVARVIRGIRTSPFGPDALPIHPAVGRHFELGYATAEAEYEQRREGRFTFRGFAERYMRYAWNADLAAGLALRGGGGDDNVALPLLQRGLARSPRSALGHAAMSEILARRDRLDDAIAEARASIAHAPHDVHMRLPLCHLLARTGDVTAAAEACRAAVAVDPDDAAALWTAAQILPQVGCRDEAIAALRRAADTVLPHDGLEPHIHAKLQALQAG
jgi:tetratricopeptide (TPR) repeat protein